MSNIVTKLDTELQKCIKTAKEISIAVAMTSDYGLESLTHTSTKCKVRIVTGVDLPTPLDVLKGLREKYGINAKVYLKSGDFFHPKVYIFKNKNDERVAYIGSGNFTSGGLLDNLELSYKISDQKECALIEHWFEGVFHDADQITDSFLKEYRPYVTNWESAKRKQSKDMSEILEKMDTIKANVDEITKSLKMLRDSNSYSRYVKERKKVVNDIKKAIDYDNDFENFDLEEFLKTYELGHIIPIRKKSLLEAVKNGKMRKLCHMLCDDSMSIEKRYELAMTKYKIDGCGCNFITKILCVHNPKKYMLWNDVSKTYLKLVAVSFERGTKDWTKYRQLCQIYAKLCKETKIKDFAVLDELLYFYICNREE